MDANCGTQSRLYYADANGILQGLEKEGDSEWVLSSVGDLNASVHPGTSITALLSPWADSIKVFYFKTGANQAQGPFVAWWTPSAGKWQTGSI